MTWHDCRVSQLFLSLLSPPKPLSQKLSVSATLHSSKSHFRKPLAPGTAPPVLDHPDHWACEASFTERAAYARVAPSRSLSLRGLSVILLTGISDLLLSVSITESKPTQWFAANALDGLSVSPSVRPAQVTHSYRDGWCVCCLCHPSTSVTQPSLSPSILLTRTASPCNRHSASYADPRRLFMSGMLFLLFGLQQKTLWVSRLIVVQLWPHMVLWTL
jgi:hypothetical protein